MPAFNAPIRQLLNHILRLSLLLPFAAVAQTSPLTNTLLPPSLQSALLEEFAAVNYRATLPANLDVMPPHDEQPMYQVIHGAYVFYLSSEGFSMRGSVLELEDFAILSDEQRERLVKETVTALDPSALLIYPPRGPKRYSVTMFTDVACPYSADLHREIDLLTDAGVEVRYLPFPRNGVNSFSHQEMRAIWCSDTPKADFSEAVEQQYFPDFIDESSQCSLNVDISVALGNYMGIVGTPTLMFEDGMISTGYSSAIDILDYLEGRGDLQPDNFSLIGEVIETDAQGNVVETAMPRLQAPDVHIMPSDAALDALRHNLQELRLLDVGVDSLTFSQQNSMYSAEVGSYLLQISNDGQYLFRANLLEEYQINNTQELARIRSYMLDRIDPKTAIVYPPTGKDIGRRIDIFLDTECPFCRAQHREVKYLNQLGVTVRYLAYPLEGAKSKDFELFTQLWCNPQRKKAVELFMQQKPLPAYRCQNHPIHAHYALAKSFKLKGSPSIILDDGTLLTGYTSSDEILERLGH